MTGYRRGAVLGLTIAETFILLTFLLLIALLGLVHQDEPQDEPLPEPETASPPRVWMRPKEIEALKSAAEEARRAQEEAGQARTAAERERDQVREKATEARRAQEEAGQARAAAERERDQEREKAAEAHKAQEKAEQARAAAERERDQVREKAAEARRAQEKAEQARAAAEHERDQEREKAAEARRAQEKAEQARAAAERERDQEREKAAEARRTQEKAEQARAAAEHERDQERENAAETRRTQEKAERARAAAERERDHARHALRKGKNPPCWYQSVSTGEGKTREKPYYAFNVAIHEDSIELAPRTAPPGGAVDDGGGLYVDEWKRLRIDDLPYGKKLNDNEFTEAVSELVAQGKNGKVRTYECVFSVKVWDKTPEHAKKRWKDAHDRIIEWLFSAYTVQEDEWKSVETRSADEN